MTTNEHPEQRKGSDPGRPDDEPPGRRPHGDPAEQTGWLDAETADHLLDARPGAPHDDERVAGLARLLASAVEEADSRPGSRNTERLVLEAFRDAHGA
ncbi:hypothetical protein, partial [Actinacidiphila rubida]